MYINAFDEANPREMFNVENKFIYFDFSPQALKSCRRTKDKTSIMLNFPAVNELFKKDFPYFRVSCVYLTLDIPEGFMDVYYSRRTFGRFSPICQYSSHRVRCTDEELDAIIRNIYRENCKDIVFLKSCLPCGLTY